MTTTKGGTSSVNGVDDLLQHIGFGRWSIVMFAPYLLLGSTLPYFSLGGAFLNPQVEHWCKIPELLNSSWTLEQRLNYSIPWEVRSGHTVRSRCKAYVRDYGSVAHLPWSPEMSLSPEEASELTTESCQSWEFDKETFSSTVSMEWDLVCDRAGVSPFFQSFYFFGTFVGEPLFGLLSDRFGRRIVIRVFSIVFLLVAYSSAWSPVLLLTLMARFILGMVHSTGVIAYVLAVESCPPSLRTTVGLMVVLPYAFAGILYGGLGYFIRDWRTLQTICVTPGIFLAFAVMFVDESPRWMIRRGRLVEGIRVLKKAARWQGVSLPTDEDLLQILQKECEVEEVALPVKSTFCGNLRNYLQDLFQLFRSPVLRHITFSMFGCWFFTGLTYWGMSLSGTHFSSNPFLYMTLMSVVEVPGYAGFTPIVSRWGRRSTLTINFFVCALAILTILITPSEYKWVIFGLAMAGKLFITGTYNILYLCASELFPTGLRSRGFNLSSMMARLGSILSPFVVEVVGMTYTWAPQFTFGCCAGLGGFLALALPESNKKPLPETVEDLELYYGNSGCRNCNCCFPNRSGSDHSGEDVSTSASESSV